jgi:hypothetical protein
MEQHFGDDSPHPILEAKSAVNELFHFHRAAPLTSPRYAGSLSAVI